MAVKLYNDCDTSAWSTSALEVNKRGGKSVYIYASENEKISPRIQLGSDTDTPLRSPFGLNSFDESQTDRKNFDISVSNEELEKSLSKIDEFALKIAHENCEKWFRKSLSENEIQSMYKPLLTISEKGYAPTVRTKVALKGGIPTRIWKVHTSSDRQLKYVEGCPDDLNRTNRYWVVVAVSGLFFMQRLFGVSLTATDIMVFPTHERIFPFISNNYECIEDNDVSENKEQLQA